MGRVVYGESNFVSTVQMGRFFSQARRGLTGTTYRCSSFKPHNKSTNLLLNQGHPTAQGLTTVSGSTSWKEPNGTPRIAVTQSKIYLLHVSRPGGNHFQNGDSQKPEQVALDHAGNAHGGWGEVER